MIHLDLSSKMLPILQEKGTVEIGQDQQAAYLARDLRLTLRWKGKEQGKDMWDKVTMWG